MQGTFGLTFIGYNQGYEDFYQKVFSQLKNFEPSEQYFNDNKERTLRRLKNEKLAEPSSRSSLIYRQVLTQNEQKTYDLIDTLKQIDFKVFLQMKELWLKNITFEWLIQGHIKQEQA